MSRLAVVAFVLASVVPGTSAGRDQRSGTDQPPLRACSLLTRELALQVTSAANRQVFDLLPPEEEQMAGGGSACEYGDIRIQILAGQRPGADPGQQLGKEWTAVGNVGDRAYFRDNRGTYAELYVLVGARALTIQMGVPTGGTAEGIRPNVLRLANALVPRLK